VYSYGAKGRHLSYGITMCYMYLPPWHPTQANAPRFNHQNRPVLDLPTSV